MKHPEYELQKAVCQYLNMQYREVLYLSDTVASIKLTKTQQARNKAIQKTGFKCPDLLILEPRKGYFGLLIELKVETPFKKDGNIKASQNDHLKLQQETLITLTGKGYKSCFAWGFENVKALIDDYLK